MSDAVKHGMVRKQGKRGNKQNIEKNSIDVGETLKSLCRSQ